MMKHPPILTVRKVHSYGAGGLAVLIPARWAREHNLEKGSEVLVLANERVIIEPSTKGRIEDLHDKFEEMIHKGLRSQGGRNGE